MRVVLLGDSTLDNGHYTAGGPSVTEHFSRLLPTDRHTTLLAVDGATTQDIHGQVDQIPCDATRVVLSVGGNDAMREIGVLERPANHVGGALKELASVVEHFEQDYRTCLQKVLDAGFSPVVCTIYNGDFSGEIFPYETVSQEVVDAALKMWNDAILQSALDHQLPVVDLRRACTAPGDFTQAIEPNEQGGRKIAEALYRAITDPEASSVRIGPTGM